VQVELIKLLAPAHGRAMCGREYHRWSLGETTSAVTATATSTSAAFLTPTAFASAFRRR
jgi:hypothetical protein